MPKIVGSASVHTHLGINNKIAATYMYTVFICPTEYILRCDGDGIYTSP